MANLLDGTGGYVSDFNLFNLNGALTYEGMGPRWPLHLEGDFVKNFGAADVVNTGYSAVLSAGRAETARDWRLSYGYLQTRIDAVLAAFSHDNFAIATNYKAHQFSVDYAVFDHLVLNGTLYSYRTLDPAYAGARLPTDWVQRLRLNATVKF